jgi:hypothetical protein
MVVLRVVSELFFSSRISEACRALEVESFATKSEARLLEMLGKYPDALVIVDLGFQGEKGGVALAGTACERIGADRVWCFFSHVAVDQLDGARALGVTRVLPRSAFFEDLGALLQTAQAQLAETAQS